MVITQVMGWGCNYTEEGHKMTAPCMLESHKNTKPFKGNGREITCHTHGTNFYYFI